MVDIRYRNWPFVFHKLPFSVHSLRCTVAHHSIIVIKDLPVKGMPRPVKAGTKVKNIRLTDGDHNIDCKIEGFGAMGLKSEFVRKA